MNLKNDLFMKANLFSLLIVTMLFQPAVKGQEAWNLRKDKNGIKVFSRNVAGFKFNELKVESFFEGGVSQMVALVLDANSQKEWAYKTIKSEILKVNSESDLIYYEEVEAPWPFSNRDFVLHLNVQQNPQNKVVNINVEIVNDFLPEKKDIVRVKYFSATWVITQLNNHQFKLDYRIQIDPGTNIPAWLANLFSTNAPYESFMHLKERIKLPQYENAHPSFIVD